MREKTFRGMTHLELLEKHLDALSKDEVVIGKAIEREIGGKYFVDAAGFDYHLEGVAEDTSEIKSTSSPKDPNVSSGNFTLRINVNPKSKKGEFKWLHIADGYNDMEFLIPEKDYWDQVGDNKEFLWSAQYNDGDRVYYNNTQWLLKYIIRDGR